MILNDAVRVRFGTAAKSARLRTGKMATRNFARRSRVPAAYTPDAASRDDVAKATTILEDVARTAGRRASSEDNIIQLTLEAAREKLAILETKRRRSTRTQAALEAAVLAM